MKKKVWSGVGLVLFSLAIFGQTILAQAAGDYDYSISQKSDNPVVRQGEDVILWVKIQNTGNATWYSDRANENNTCHDENGELYCLGALVEPLRLGTVRPTDRNSGFFTQDNWVATNRVHKADEEEIMPGGVASFGFYATVPYDMNPGIYRECFAPVVENTTWMGDKGICWDINVVDNPEEKSYKADTINDYDTSYIQLAPGEQKKITLKAKNTGTETWTRSGQYPIHLATDKPKDRASDFYDTNWLSENRLTMLNEENVKPGGSGSFSFTLTAPIKAEVGDEYYEYYRLVAEGKQWLGSSDSLDAFGCGGNKLGEKIAYTQCAGYYDGFIVVAKIVDDESNIETNVGEKFTFELDSNGTTGYAWDVIGQPDKNIIELDEAGYRDECPADLTGCGNPQYWTFKALKEGKTQIELQYRRSWETDVEPLQTKKYNILVLSKLEAQENLKEMAENLSEVKSLEYNGEFKMSSEDEKIDMDIDFSGGTDENNINNPLGYFLIGFNLVNTENDLKYTGDLEWRTIDNVDYLKLDYQSEVANPEIKKYLDVINDQWIKMDKETDVEDFDLGMFNEELGSWQDKLTEEQQEKIKELNQKYQIMKVSEIMADTTVEGVAVYHYRYMIDIAEMEQMINELDQVLSPELNPYRNPSMDDAENLTGEIWIGKTDLLPYKMTVEMDEIMEATDATIDFTMYFKNFNQPLTIEAPATAKTIDEIAEEMEEIE